MTGQAKKAHEAYSNQRNAQERPWRRYESAADVMKKVSDEAVKQINELFGETKSKPKSK